MRSPLRRPCQSREKKSSPAPAVAGGNADEPAERYRNSPQPATRGRKTAFPPFSDEDDARPPGNAMQRRHVSGSLTLPVRHTAKQRRFPAYQRTEHGPPLVRQHVPVSSKARKTPFRVLLRTRGMARICHKADKFLTRQQKKFFTYTQMKKMSIYLFFIII